MNDDQLSRELGRRAGSVSLDHDWAQRELLPAVNHEIRSRPQRVASSRLPGLVGLTAVAAILLVLVVALPRSAPAPGSTDPPTRSTSAATATQLPDALRVLSAQEFATAVRQSHLRSATVLVDGAIIGNQQYGFGACITQNQTCLMGRLDRIDPSVDINSSPINTTEDDPARRTSSARVWPWSYRPSAPVSGTLVLSVDGEGSVEFIGQVEGGWSKIPLPVPEAAKRDAASLPLGDVILVEGWLDGQEWSGPRGTMDCRASPLGGEMAGLPSRQCANWDLLTSAPAAANAEVVDLKEAIVVQKGAPAMFGAPGQPSHGIFAVSRRLYGGGCISDPPCWQWEVVGRLSAETQTPTTTPTPSEDPEPTGRSISEFDCAGSPPDFANGAVRIEDHSGLVIGCEASSIDFDDLIEPSSATDPPSVTLTWPVPCSTDSWRTLLQFWPPPNGDSSEKPSHLLIADRKSPLGDGGCFTAMSGRQVRIDLAAPLDWTEIEQVFLEDGRGTASQHTDAGDFELELTAGASEYAAGEPVDISASVTYRGPAESVTVTGVGDLVNGFGIRQIDGPISIGPGWDEPCVQDELENGVPQVEPYRKSGGWSPDDPLAELYQAFFDDPEFRLPAGTYIITAYSEFYAGDCGGELVDLAASVVIRVR